MSELQSLITEAQAQIAATEDLAALDQVRVDFLGKRPAYCAIKIIGRPFC